MSIASLMDSIFDEFIDMEIAPSRAITYTRSSDLVSISLNSFVGNGEFNKDEKEKLSDWQSFSGLKLSQKPKVNDTIVYNAESFLVQRYVSKGLQYEVFARISRHSGRPSK